MVEIRSTDVVKAIVSANYKKIVLQYLYMNIVIKATRIKSWTGSLQLNSKIYVGI